MRNMKSLHIFHNYVIKREEKFQDSLWENERSNPPWNMKSQGSNVTHRSSCNSIYVIFSFMRRVGTSLLILSVDRLMRVDYSPHSLYSFELWVLKYFVGLISCCSLPFVDYSLMPWVIWIIPSVNMCCELFPSCMKNLGWLSS